MNVEEPKELPETISAALARADELRVEGQLALAINQLETELAGADTAGLTQFKGRVSLALAIAELCVAAGDNQKAQQTLFTEATTAKLTFAEIKASGTEDEKRMAFRGLVQMRDFHTQIGLVGRPAPDFAVKEWVIGPATTLSDLKGKVTVLEFWATWCKPCEQVFPKLNQLHQEHSDRGLSIVALTRFFMSYGAPEQMQREELALIGSFVENLGVQFRVGVSEDEQTQTRFGATGLPLMVLVDRRGLVRNVAVSTEDERFQSLLSDCLEERV
jgi:thiol-disulfide isomerase/thioredoxin